jgi:hypothetical protein
MKSRTGTQSGADNSAGIELLDRSARTINEVERDRLRAIVMIDREGRWENDGAASYAAWLSTRYGMTRWRARREIACAYALEGLPRVAAALSSGALHLDKVLELTRFAAEESEEELVRWARRSSPAAIRRRGDELERQLDDVKDAYEERYVRTWWRADGSALHLEGLLPAAEGMKVKKALDRLARSLPDMPLREDGTRPDEDTNMDQKRADAFGMMAAARISRDQDPDRATVVMFAPWDALATGKLGCELEDGPLIHPDTAKRLVCDSIVQPIAQGKDGDIGIGRRSQIAPRWLRRLMKKKFAGRCCFHGCDQRELLTPHHVRHWTPEEGVTDLFNLVPLCPRHHWLVHEGGWSVVIGMNDEPVFFRPSGRVFEPGPPGVDEAMAALVEEEANTETEPKPDPFEESYGVKNFELKEMASGFSGDLYELAKHLAGV